MSMIENLEGRQLLAAATLRVGSVLADNRGTVVVRFSDRTVGVKGSAFQVYTAGPDGKLYTNDDKRESVGYSYSTNKKTLTIRGHLAKDTPYRIKLDGKTRIKSEATGELLDGDYNGTFASGDGKAGGNFEAQFSRDKSTTPVAYFRTSAGDFRVRLRGDLSAIQTTVNNFLSYANKGLLDNTIYHRTQLKTTQGIGIVQGGGYYSSAQVDGQINGTTYLVPRDEVPSMDPIPLQAGALSNLRGTLAMARLGGSDPNTATHEFYFNDTDNTELDATGPGTGYAVFGEIIDSDGLAAIDAIGNAPQNDLSASGKPSSTFTDLPRINGQDVITYRIAALMVVSAK